MYKRQLSPTFNKSFFLFGPRQTGKSTFIKTMLSEKDIYIDLLPQSVFLSYAKNPGRFREEILAHLAHSKKKEFICAVDEVQKLPGLLDEIHALIEETKITFIMTGSSARKLKRGASNLLAGRAYTYHLFPLTYKELKDDFNLEKILIYGSLPSVFQKHKDSPQEFLQTYTSTYLKEEIKEEGIVRELGPFSNFLDLAAANDGEIVNCSNIARECGVSVKTVQQYYQILEDTFLAYKLVPWTKSVRTRLTTHPKYYFFDPGVTNALTHQLGDSLDPITKGRRFEQYIIQQINAAISYNKLDLQLFYWRTYSGSEVDLIIAKGSKPIIAIEIKSSTNVSKVQTLGLKNFSEQYPDVQLFVVSINERERLLNENIRIINWKYFIDNIKEFCKIKS